MQIWKGSSSTICKYSNNIPTLCLDIEGVNLDVPQHSYNILGVFTNAASSREREVRSENTATRESSRIHC